MVSYTTRLQATKPASSENVNVTLDLGANFDRFDAAAGASVGVSASRPASAFQGRMWYSTDLAKLYVNTAASASAVASWQDPVATGLGTSLSLSGNLTVGGNLTVTGKGAKAYVRKSSSTGRASTTTLADDPHITFPLVANATYLLRVFLAVTGASGGDIKTSYNITGAASAGNHSGRFEQGPASGTTSAISDVMRSTQHSWSSSVSYGLDGSNVSAILEEGIIDTSTGSGNVTLQWAQNSSTATSTVMSGDSYATLERLA